MAQATRPISEGCRLLEKIVSNLLQRHDTGPFRERVDYRLLNLPDYPDKVKKPIDLGTIKQRLNQGEYRTAEQGAKDVRLVWENCKLYNGEGSELYNLAVSLSKKFEEKYEKILPHLRDAEAPGGRDDQPAPTPEEKRRFASNLYRIKTEQLTSIITKLDHRCPEALEKVEGGDEIEINLDKIDSRTFHEINRSISSSLSHTEWAAPVGAGTGGGSSSGKKKKSTSNSGGGAGKSHKKMKK